MIQRRINQMSVVIVHPLLLLVRDRDTCGRPDQLITTEIESIHEMIMEDGPIF